MIFLSLPNPTQWLVSKSPFTEQQTDLSHRKIFLIGDLTDFLPSLLLSFLPALAAPASSCPSAAAAGRAASLASAAAAAGAEPAAVCWTK